MNSKGKVFWLSRTDDGDHYALRRKKTWNVTQWIDLGTWESISDVRLQPGEGPIKCRIERVE